MELNFIIQTHPDTRSSSPVPKKICNATINKCPPARGQGKAHKSKKSHQKIINTMLVEILSPIAEEPCVRWVDTLVESVHTRPRTLPEDTSALFYSRADMNRFEREAEMEPTPSLSPRWVRWADALETQIHIILKRHIIKAKHPSRGSSN